MLAFTSLLLVVQASASVLNAAHVVQRGHVVQRSEAIKESMRRYVDSIIEPLEESMVERRQSSTAIPNSGVNITEWDATTAAACTTALDALNGTASNPSGMAVCYNLPYLDNSTGVFEADLRLYMISAPTGDFQNIASSDVQVGLSYNGATVSAVNASSLKKRSEATSLISWPRAADIGKRASTPALVQSYAFVGQVNQNLLSTNMSTADWEKVLVPTVSLTGTDSTGLKVNTTLSDSEATFVSGVFSQKATITKAQVAAPLQTLVVASGEPFVVPGLNILIIPIGLIITSIWTVLFLGTIAYGTVGRMQFREQYRRRSARATKGDQARI